MDILTGVVVQQHQQQKQQQNGKKGQQKQQKQQKRFLKQSSHATVAESNVVQELIYFFNEPVIRNYLVNMYLHQLYPETVCQYAGTFFLKELSDDSLDLEMDNGHHPQQTDSNFKSGLLKNKDLFLTKGKKTLFTLAILYHGNAIHFVSFLYDYPDGKLICFDPGYNLYQNGTRVLIPNCRNIFLQLGWIRTEDDCVIIGRCHKIYHGRRYGIQYNGTDPDKVRLPADAFCQSWTLFFVLTCIMYNGDWNFVWAWCKIKPSQREQFILERFFFPMVLMNPPVLKKFRTKFSETHVRAIENLYATTLMTHWIIPEHRK